MKMKLKNAKYIYINDEKIDFTYYYRFYNKGKYIIKNKFKKLLNSSNYMFYGCKSLSSLDLSEGVFVIFQNGMGYYPTR